MKVGWDWCGQDGEREIGEGMAEKARGKLNYSRD